MFKSTIYIENCEVIIFIMITINRIIQTKFMHFTKVNLISSYFEKWIFIHRIFVSDCDHLFESIDLINFFIYAHLINIQTNFILIRNNCDKTFKIFRNFKLDKIIKSEYINAF